MPVTVRGTDILFNNGTTQNTAAVVDTTSVLNATAGASVGAVGTYGFFFRELGNNTTLAAGSTSAGSSLQYSGADYNGASGGIFGSPSPAGTWRLMGRLVGNIIDYGTFNLKSSVWLRIS